MPIAFFPFILQLELYVVMFEKYLQYIYVIERCIKLYYYAICLNTVDIIKTKLEWNFYINHCLKPLFLHLYEYEHEHECIFEQGRKSLLLVKQRV